VATTGIAMIFPYFNQVLGVQGSLIFWPLSVYFPVEMYFKQRNIQAWTTKWVMLRTFSIFCLLLTLFALIGSIQGLVSAKLSWDTAVLNLISWGMIMPQIVQKQLLLVQKKYRKKVLLMMQASLNFNGEAS
jgi:hypothetical protein